MERASVSAWMGVVLLSRSTSQLFRSFDSRDIAWMGVGEWAGMFSG